jgi:hypothetical protein
VVRWVSIESRCRWKIGWAFKSCLLISE